MSPRRVIVTALVGGAAAIALGAPAASAAVPQPASPEDRGVCLYMDDPRTPYADRLCVFTS